MSNKCANLYTVVMHCFLFLARRNSRLLDLDWSTTTDSVSPFANRNGERAYRC